MSSQTITDQTDRDSRMGAAFAQYQQKLDAEVTDTVETSDRDSRMGAAFAQYQQKLDTEVPDELDETSRIKLQNSMGKNPDVMSEVHNEAEASGVPVPVVESNIDEIKQQRQIRSISPSKNPATSSFLSQDYNADVAHDDIDFLKGFEDHMGALNVGVLSFPQMVTGGTAAALEAGARMVERALPDEWVEAVNEFEGAFVNEDYTPAGVLRNVESGFKQVSDYLGPKEQTFSTQVVTGIGQAVAQIGAMLVAPQAALPSLMAQQVSQQEQLQIESGTDHTFMADVGLLASSGMAIVEKLGIDKLLDRVPPQIKNKIVQKLTDVALGGGYEAATEVLEGIGHGLIEYHSSNPDAEIFKGAAENAAVGGSVGAIIRAIIPGFKGRGIKTPEVKQAELENQTDLEQGHIDKTTTLLQEGTVPTRDPKAFKRFTDEIGGDTGYKVSAEAFQDYEGDVPEFIAARDDVVGGDMEMSLDLYANEVVNNPELLAAVRPHMRISDDTMTQAEVAAGGMTTVDNLMRDAAANAEITTEVDEVVDDVVTQLVATGRESVNNAKKKAVMVAGYMETAARKRGLSVKEVYAKSGLKIQKVDSKKHDFGEEVMTQEFIVEGTGQKGKVREKKQVVYDQKLKQQDMITKLRDCVNG